MRQLTNNEIMSLRELIQMDSNALAKGKASMAMITDEELRLTAQAGMQAIATRIKGLQQFVVENNIIDTKEVH